MIYYKLIYNLLIVYMGLGVGWGGKGNAIGQDEVG